MEAIYTTPTEARVMGYLGTHAGGMVQYLVKDEHGFNVVSFGTDAQADNYQRATGAKTVGIYTDVPMSAEAVPVAEVVAALREVSAEISNINRTAGETRFNPAATGMVRRVLDRLTGGA